MLYEHASIILYKNKYHSLSDCYLSNTHELEIWNSSSSHVLDVQYSRILKYSQYSMVSIPNVFKLCLFILSLRYFLKVSHQLTKLTTTIIVQDIFLLYFIKRCPDINSTSILAYSRILLQGIVGHRGRVEIYSREGDK